MAQAVYRVVEGCPAGQLEETLNAIAAEGWELREIFPAEGAGASKAPGYDIIFVRRKEAGAAAGFHVGRP